MFRRFLYIFLVGFSVLTSCREDDFISPSDSVEASDSGMYILCEGNMGSNKCTLDYLDLKSMTYSRNVYPASNPNVVKELGDVGNDIQINGNQLWIVVNCSHKVEVCDVRTARRIGKVDIPNCRYVCFDDNGYAYVSSYVGPVQIDANAQIGMVYKVDTRTLKVVGTVEVGYQPDELAVSGGKLYVANSGGYRVPNYDTRVSVIDLATFTLERQIEVAPNLFRLKADRHGQVWVSSRGDYNTTPPRLYCLSKDASGTMQPQRIDVPVSEMCIVGDSLYYLGVSWNNATATNDIQMGIIDITTHQPISSSAFGAGIVSNGAAKGVTIEVPYGLIVNPTTRDIFIMDAKDYVSSGELLMFDREGNLKNRWWTGDIPSRAVFVSQQADVTPQKKEEPYKPNYDGTYPYILAVDEYVPAPGQFVNTMPQYEPGDDAAAMARKCTDAIGGETDGMVSLGGFGGYITFHFDHSVRNIPGEKDLYIKGNAFYATGSANGGSCEPGIVMVSQDLNNNGIPDDPWYELSGSADVDSVGKVKYGYEITYRHDPMKDVPWTDNQGNSGTVARNTSHRQEYFPLWLSDKNGGILTLRGTLLPDNAYDRSGRGFDWFHYALRYGYVDNLPNTDIEGCSFNIDWAVDPITREPKILHSIDFVRVYSAQNQVCGWLGETSTEVCGAMDLHMKTP